MPAWQHIEEGQRQGWAPDAELCEMLIEVICRVKSRLERGLEFVRDDMPVRGHTLLNKPSPVHPCSTLLLDSQQERSACKACSHIWQSAKIPTWHSSLLAVRNLPFCS